MKAKNVLLTTLGTVEGDRLQHRYFYFNDGKDIHYCDGIMTPEAGAKYILAQERIDSIVVLGGGASYDKGDELHPLPLSEKSDWGTDIMKMSDYSFFRYRLSQYRDGVDLEGLDVLEKISPERAEYLKSVFEEIKKYLKKTYKDYRRGMEFHFLSLQKNALGYFRMHFTDLTEDDLIWLKRFAYTKMKPEKKLTMLDANRDLTVSFIPSMYGMNEKISNVSAILKAIKKNDNERINLYMDMQGTGSANGYTLISVMSMLDNEINKGLDVKEIITTHYNPSNFANPIDNKEKEKYDISTLVSGVSAFINYGKVDNIRDYWMSLGEKDPYIEKMLLGMTYIDAGVSLCHIDSLKTGVSILKEAFSEADNKEQSKRENALADMLEQTIKADYGKLLDGDEVSMLELAKWSFRKHFYQQTLTIIEARVPDEIVRKSLFYYAQTEEDRQAMLSSLQDCYENTNPLQRWSFKDVDHYFMKYYKRYVAYTLNIRDDLARSRFFIDMRMNQLTKSPEENYGCVKAFSLLDDKPELLRELLASYDEMGPLRNKLNHSDSSLGADEADAGSDDYKVGPREYLKVRVEKFLKVYEKAMDAADERRARDGEPSNIIISGDDFKEYSIAESRNRKYNGGGNNNNGNNNNNNLYGNKNNGGGNNYNNNNNHNNNNQYGNKNNGGGKYNKGYKGGRNNGYKGNYNESEATVQTPAGEIHIHIHLDGLK